METYRQDWLGAIKWLMTDPFNLDLDALEREYTGPSDNVIRDQRILALIQRLREADQQLTEMAETFGGQADRIERYEAHITQLERVREAAQRVQADLTVYSFRPQSFDDLDAALAAVEEK